MSCLPSPPLPLPPVLGLCPAALQGLDPGVPQLAPTMGPECTSLACTHWLLVIGLPLVCEGHAELRQVGSGFFFLPCSPSGRTWSMIVPEHKRERKVFLQLCKGCTGSHEGKGGTSNPSSDSSENLSVWNSKLPIRPSLGPRKRELSMMCSCADTVTGYGKHDF